MTMTSGKALPSWQKFRERLESLRNGRARKPASSLEAAALRFSDAPSYENASAILMECKQAQRVRVVRPLLLSAIMRVMHLCDVNRDLSFPDAAKKVRSEYRYRERIMPKRAVGSTLLFKGLETDGAIVVYDGASMGAKHLYVALTRASKRIVVYSESAVLNRRGV